ncbi:class I adenylate-forming enzyme family protein [Dietzia natronolimnaea]|uniref:class I adenylate-forming enzyme family protein n=1 Tax=Dietzia natronolimnaea TaxID=161920 RepID=UPI001FE770AE|nr:class I adenylate-forming enzyme family protein [Dietzia natronolimnaea]
MEQSVHVASGATESRQSSADGRTTDRSLTSTQSTLLGRATLGDQLRRHAQSRAGTAAIVSYAPGGGRTVTTYGELDRSANRAAHMLLGLGVSRGDRVAVMARNRVESVIAYYGALKIGAAYSGINVLLGVGEVAHQLNHLEPAAVVVAAEFLPVVRAALGDSEARPEIVVLDAADSGSADDPGCHDFDRLIDSSPDSEPECDVDELDLAMIVYTSGTEAAPKGVMLPHRNYLISTSPAYTWGLRCLDDDVWLFVMPFHTIAGIGSLTSLILLGATLVLPASLAPADVLAMIKTEQISVLAQTPTFFISLADHPDFGPDAVGTIQRCLTYGGQVSPRTVDAWHRAAPRSIWGTYWGQSELTQLGSVGWFKQLEDVPGQDPTWIGKPVGHLEIKVVDADGNESESGELLCRTPSVMAGYYKDPEKTAAVLDGGWLHTGDIVRRDAEGNMFFLDRNKDMIKTGGYNVSSQEVERVLQAHPGVARAAVVGLPDEYWSEAVSGFVIAVDGSDVSGPELRDHCKTVLAGYKVPKVITIVDELPTDPQGKLLKRELRRLHAKD